MLESHRSLCESFSRRGAELCIYHSLVWSKWNFLHISQWITLPTQSCLALYSFCANLLHSLIMRLIVSSLSSHSLHLLFYCVLSILALIWLVLMALSWAAIRRDSVSLLRFPFLSQVLVFWCEMFIIIIIIIIWFSASLSISYNSTPGLYRGLRVKEGFDHMHLKHFYFCSLFWVISHQSHWQYSLMEMSSFAKCVFFSLFTLPQSVIFLMCLSLSFRIIHRTYTISRTVVVFRWTLFQFLFPGFCIELFTLFHIAF